MAAPPLRRRTPGRSSRWLYAIALLLALALLGGCTSVFLQPDRKHYLPDQALPTPAEDVWITAPGGARLHALYLPATGTPRGALLFLHGNAENLSSHVHAVTWLPAQGYHVLALDYRGYGRSEGHASVDGIHEDARLALRWLQSHSGTLPLFVYGQSLGGTVALNLVARGDTDSRRRIAAVIADSAFSSYRGIAREKLDSWWLTWPLQAPLSWLVSDAWSPLAVVDRISPIPLLLIHGERDAVVPPQHAAQLFARAGEPKALWPIAGGRHINAMRRDEVRARLLDYLAEAGAAATVRPGPVLER